MSVGRSVEAQRKSPGTIDPETGREGSLAFSLEGPVKSMPYGTGFISYGYNDVEMIPQDETAK
jgi:hypothetical protein